MKHDINHLNPLQLLHTIYIDILTTFLISVRPVIKMNIIEQSPHKENDTLTMECIIDRLYPQIQPANFTMRWGDTIMHPGQRNNIDGSFSYRVEITKTLTKEDNGMTVTCNVNPVRGTSVSEQRTPNVQCEYLSCCVMKKVELLSY